MEKRKNFIFNRSLDKPLRIAFRFQLAVGFFLFLNYSSFAQNESEYRPQLDSAQLEIQHFGKKVLTAQDDVQKRAASAAVLEKLSNALQLPGALEYPFDSLSTLSDLISSDHLVRLFTWNVPLEDGSYEFHGILAYFNRRKKEWTTYPLIDSSSTLTFEDRLVLYPENWYGALYYDIIKTKKKRQVSYTLIGWKGNNKVSTKKVIDVLRFTRNGQPQFGENLFNIADNTKKTRIIYEFSAEVSMSIHFDRSKRLILLDHLFPSHPRFEGHYEFYGPDLSFDAFLQKDGEWMYVEDYDPGVRPTDKTRTLKGEKKMYDSGN